MAAELVQHEAALAAALLVVAAVGAVGLGTQRGAWCPPPAPPALPRPATRSPLTFRHGAHCRKMVLGLQNVCERELLVTQQRLLHSE